jgi:putative ABC transport system permease protein
MNSLWQDLRYGARMLWKQPGFTLIAVLTLALGIGATSTIFSFVNGILLRPLPYQDPARLVLLDETSSKRGGSFGVSFPNFLDWRAQNQVFTSIAAYGNGGYTLTGSGEPEQLSGGQISYDTFEILGVAPILGRSFHAEEDQPDQDQVVILSYGLWQRRFGAKPEIIGQTISLNNRPRTVIGVMPPGFKFPELSDLWVPLALDTKRWTRNDHGLASVARLKDGVTLTQAQADIDAVARRIEEQNPVTNEGMGVKLEGLRSGLTSDYRTSLPLLLGVVGMVLLIACANVANLLLARATVRRKEIAVRAALGASRSVLFRQLLVESLLLGALGGAFGLALAWWGLDLVLAAIPIDFPFWMKFNLDWRVIGFTSGVALLTGLIFGTAPALQASRVNLNEALKEGGRSGGSAGRHRLRSLLVVVEVALSLVLLIGAGLMMRSFLRLQQVNPGFNPEHLLTARVSLPGARYDKPEKRQAFFQQFLERASTLPGVQAVGGTSNMPLRGWWGRSLTVEGFPVLSVGQAPMIFHNVITPNYFRAMGIPLLAGRDFTKNDTRDTLKVTIIDERLAREYWPNESPLGKRIRFGPPEDNEPWHTIVGVVGEVKQESLDLARRRSVYLPHGEISIGGLTLAVRATADPESLAATLRRELKAVDPELPLTQVLTMNEILSRSIWQPRLYAILFGVFATLALLLAAVGIYGVMSYAVTQRIHEIGVRLALGAQSGDLLRLVLGRGMKLVALGLAAGLVSAFGLTKLMQTLLFNINASDPLTFAVIALLLTLVALLACYIPARRATKVDPLVALRCE